MNKENVQIISKEQTVKNAIEVLKASPNQSQPSIKKLPLMSKRQKISLDVLSGALLTTLGGDLLVCRRTADAMIERMLQVNPDLFK